MDAPFSRAVSSVLNIDENPHKDDDEEVFEINLKKQLIDDEIY